MREGDWIDRIVSLASSVVSWDRCWQQALCRAQIHMEKLDCGIDNKRAAASAALSSCGCDLRTRPEHPLHNRLYRRVFFG